MTSALTWCANIFVGSSVTPTFFRQITSFFDSLHYTKKPKKSVWEVLIKKTIKKGSNWYMDTGVRDLEVIFLKANSSRFNDICSKDLHVSNRPI